MADDVEAPGKCVKVREIDRAAKRAKLPARENPYWLGISGGRGDVLRSYYRGSCIAADIPPKQKKKGRKRWSISRSWPGCAS